MSRQQRGSVATITGEVAPGEIAFHRVAYATEGSQNDVQVSWPYQYAAGGPGLAIYATRAGCEAFAPPPAISRGDCAVLARAGVTDSGQIATTLIVTHGRGNPEVLGSPPEYKLWIAGDARQPVRYTIAISYFYGPDC